MLSLLRNPLSKRLSPLIHRTKCLKTTSKLNVSTYKAVIFDMGGVILPSPFNAAYKWQTAIFTVTAITCKGDFECYKNLLTVFVYLFLLVS